MSGLSPAHRTPFVGRQRELAVLQERRAAAGRGEGGVVLVAGEPGIGKTALCSRSASAVAEQGGRVLIGHCYEEGSLSLPYLPFVEALRSYILTREPEALVQELGDGAAEVARIVPELRRRVPITIDTTAVHDPEEARYRLLQAVSDFLRAIASDRPLVLLLEDLHDADRGTLDLLVHLARSQHSPPGIEPAAASGLLIIGTYRDVEVDRAHPLSATLAELRRVAPVERLALRGLVPAEVRQLVADTAPDAPPGLTEAVYRQTEGNPLFVQEVLRWLADDGTTSRQNERAHEFGIPEGLRDVIGQRLSRLSADCNRVLGVAAVIGREFDLAVLEAVAGVGEDTLLAALEEAVRAGVLEEQERPGSVAYRFAHALFRQTLYEELIAARRIRLHQQVARALEAHHAARLEEHAAELAEHYGHSSSPADLAKAVQHGELAAQRAMAVYAYGEAARLLEQAAQVQDVLDPDDHAKQCDLLLAIGDALVAAGELRRAIDEVAPEAFTLAGILADQRRASRACQLALWGFNRYGAGQVTGTAAYRQWAERADRYAAPGTMDRVHADIALASTRERTPRDAEAWPLYLRALDVARTLDDPNTLFFAAGCLGWSARAPRHRDQLRRIAQEFATRDRAGLTARSLGILLGTMGGVYLDWGDRAQAEAMWGELEQLAAHTHDANTILVTFLMPIVFARLDGRLEDAVRQAEELVARADALGMPVYGRQNAWLTSWQAQIHLGHAEAALAATRQIRGLSGLAEDADPPNPTLACCLAHLGRLDAAREQVRRCLQWWGVEKADTSVNAYILTMLLETAVLIGDKDGAPLLAQRLDPIADSAMAMWAWGGTCVARHLGGAAALLGDRAAARAYYEQALQVAGTIRFRPEIALTRLGLAELLRDGDRQARDEALGHLTTAIAELEAMGMQPALARARHLEEHLRAGARRTGSRAYPDGLTAREVEVLGLIAGGQSNQAIADALVLSLRTVERHTVNIYAKIGARGRADAVAYALHHQLPLPKAQTRRDDSPST